MTDAEILALYWRRDEAALAATREKYGAYCHAVADNILSSHEDAEECVSDALWRAWNAIPPQRPAYLRAFLAKITRNLALNRYKARAAEKRGGGELPAVLEELADCLPAKADVESEVQAKELTAGVNHFLRTLPPRECDVFLRRYFYVEPVADIARRYALRESHVLVLLSRTRNKLRRYLRQEGYIE